MRGIMTHPNAIWFWRTAEYAAFICIVNDLYRYEILDSASGRQVHMASLPTLAEAKAEALNFFETIGARS
jgi:hypothetical protein